MSDESFVSVRNSDKGPQRSTLEELAITWALLIVTVVASYLIQRNHMGHIIPPSAAAMVLGMIFGWSVSVINASSDLRFSPGIFLYGLLPPIVFAAGFNLNKKDFFQNFGAITLFAVVGTVISTLVFGMGTYLLYAVGAIKKSSFQGKPFVESLLYGALVSAIDPVATLSVFSDINAPPLLYNLVFGESVLNDAVAIVLFRTLKEAYHRPFDFSTLCYLVWRFSVISIGSIVIGVAVTLLCALVLKQLQLGQQNINRAAQFDATVYEVSLVLLSAYMAYIITEAFNLSGIVALFFAGICHAHYTFYNVSKEAGISIRKALDASAFLSETFVFAYLGLQVATFKHKLDAGLLLSALPLCLLSRAANIFPLAALVNTKRRPPLAMPLQIMQWACGLRGAVAYALAVFFPRPDDGGDDSPETQQDSDAAAYPAIETTTLFIVVASTLLFGTATAPLMRFLGLQVPLCDLQDGRAGEGPAEVLLDSIDDSSRSGGTTGPAPPSSTRLRWRDFDRRYLKPLFGGQEGPTLPAVNLPATHSLGSQGSIAAGTTPLLSPGSLADPAAADSGANDTAGAPTGLARVASGMERQALQMQSLD